MIFTGSSCAGCCDAVSPRAPTFYGPPLARPLSSEGGELRPDTAQGAGAGLGAICASLSGPKVLFEFAQKCPGDVPSQGLDLIEGSSLQRVRTVPSGRRIE